VSHQDFWKRYFYKLHQLSMDEARKQALMKRAERAHVKEDSIGWEEGADQLPVLCSPVSYYNLFNLLLLL